MLVLRKKYLKTKYLSYKVGREKTEVGRESYQSLSSPFTFSAKSTVGLAWVVNSRRAESSVFCITSHLLSESGVDAHSNLF